MSKRLQVLMPDHEYRALVRAAKKRGSTVAQVVRESSRASSQTRSVRDVVRARIVLQAAAGLSNATISRNVGQSENTVRKWRRRFAEGRNVDAGGRPRVGAAHAFADLEGALDGKRLTMNGERGRTHAASR